MLHSDNSVNKGTDAWWNPPTLYPDTCSMCLMVDFAIQTCTVGDASSYVHKLLGMHDGSFNGYAKHTQTNGTACWVQRTAVLTASLEHSAILQSALS